MFYSTRVANSRTITQWDQPIALWSVVIHRTDGTAQALSALVRSSTHDYKIFTVNANSVVHYMDLSGHRQFVFVLSFQYYDQCAHASRSHAIQVYEPWAWLSLRLSRAKPDVHSTWRCCGNSCSASSICNKSGQSMVVYQSKFRISIWLTGMLMAALPPNFKCS